MAEEGKVPARPAASATEASSLSAEALLDQAVERSVLHAVFGHDPERRALLRLMGTGAALAAVESIFPLSAARAIAQEGKGGIEKKAPRIGFIPITCATPIIMAHPMGFYSRHGLDAVVEKVAGWAMIRDKAIAGETDATHMLSPMPLATTMGLGSQAVPFVLPAIENVNGQAITLHVKHKDKMDPKQWKGFTFCVPFEYSMHNLLLRYVVAEAGLNPDVDIKIRVVPPPEMVANLQAENVDGYLGPDPFNQRAVFQGVGFIWKLTKDIWDGHPCCAFACSKAFMDQNPNTFRALLKALLDATQYAKKAENRKEVAAAIAPRNYLNQPVVVVEQVLTGQFPDGLGNMMNVPNRIDFDPFPFHSMAIWIMTQLKRWGYVSGNVDYAKVAEQVFLAGECKKLMGELGHKTHDATSKKHIILGKEFDPAKPEEYLASFKIRKA